MIIICPLISGTLLDAHVEERTLMPIKLECGSEFMDGPLERLKVYRECTNMVDHQKKQLMKNSFQ